MHSLTESYKVFTGLPVQNITSATATAGTGVDCLEMGLNCSAILNLGTQTALTSSTVKIQESDVVGSGYADIPGAVFAATDADDDDKVAAIDFIRTKRFIRVVDTTVGTVTAHNVGVNLLVEAGKGGAALNSATAA